MPDPERRIRELLEACDRELKRRREAEQECRIEREVAAGLRHRIGQLVRFEGFCTINVFETLSLFIARQDQMAHGDEGSHYADGTPSNAAWAEGYERARFDIARSIAFELSLDEKAFLAACDLNPEAAR